VQRQLTDQDQSPLNVWQEFCRAFPGWRLGSADRAHVKSYAPEPLLCCLGGVPCYGLFWIVFDREVADG
jgi:hypothetical protein